jgi:hypothetical protein
MRELAEKTVLSRYAAKAAINDSQVIWTSWSIASHWVAPAMSLCLNSSPNSNQKVRDHKAKLTEI